MANVEREFYANAGALLGPGGKIGLVSGFNPSVTTYYLQLHNSLAPAPGAVPKKCFLVPGFGNFSYGPSSFAKPWTASCVFRVSSTPNVLTAAAQVFWVEVEGVE